MSTRHEPYFNHTPTRTLLGLFAAAASPFIGGYWLGGEPALGATSLVMVLLMWLPAFLLTARYTHKYPQRYLAYLVACHFKGFMVMLFVAAMLWIVGVVPTANLGLLWLSLIVFVTIDLLFSLPFRKQVVQTADANLETPSRKQEEAEDAREEHVAVDLAAIASELSKQDRDHIAQQLRDASPESEGNAGPSNSNLLVVDDLDEVMHSDDEEWPHDIGAVAGTVSLNQVSRLNYFLRYCTSRLAMGGYLVVSYLPMEVVLSSMKSLLPRWVYPLAYLAHFIRYRALPKIPWLAAVYFAMPWIDQTVQAAFGPRNRALSKAEVWGRLAYFGLEVLQETADDNGIHYIVAQRAAQPVANNNPSYFAVVALEKVGLDGKVIRLHKVRSMYPFSEFLQKKIFQSHGLSNTGKFKNDFRLTDYGPVIRRNWIDEIPGIFDWLRGDVKLVGMRATSPHFLSLYPQDVYDLYIQVKPGLVPPIFDEKTTGFDQIVEIEREYLRRYLKAPIRTDILYFWYTFRDIFIRRVRSA